MAKNDNLTDFLTDVADAIRAKKGISNPINPQNFASEIASIETGGGGGGNSGGGNSGGGNSDVRFLDYDGTLLHSFSKDDFLALSALPDLPTRAGLTCQGWNYTLEDAQEYVASYGVLDVGATYITDDGKTRLYIKIAAKGRMTVPLYFSQTVANGVTIDWGDGSATQTLSGTDNVNTTHTYTEIGEYTISLDVAEGCTSGLGRDLEYHSVMGEVNSYERVYCNMLQAVEIGKGVKSIGYSAFQSCFSLASIVIPQGVTSIGNNAFYNCASLASVVIPSSVANLLTWAFRNCFSLASVVIPQGVTDIGYYTFQDCSSLASVVIPQSVTYINDIVFSNCASLASVVIPSSVTRIGYETFKNCYSLTSGFIPEATTWIGPNMFYGCSSLASVVIPQRVRDIDNYAFYNCASLASVVIPSSVTRIGEHAFYNCKGMAYYDFRASTSIPTLSDRAAFNGISSDCKIVVPDALYDTWIAATNWSTYASYIIKASEFNG